MKVRIVQDYRGYYPQVKVLFGWERVIRYADGSFDTSEALEHPKPYKDCEEILDEFFKWKKKGKKVKVIRKWEIKQPLM